MLLHSKSKDCLFSALIAITRRKLLKQWKTERFVLYQSAQEETCLLLSSTLTRFKELLISVEIPGSVPNFLLPVFVLRFCSLDKRGLAY